MAMVIAMLKRRGEIMNTDFQEMLADGLEVADKLLREVPDADYRLLLAQAWMLGNAAGLLNALGKLETSILIASVKH